MTEELRALIERLCRQPEGVQRHMAEIIHEDLDEGDEYVPTPEELAAIEQSHAEIEAGDWISLEEYLRERDCRDQRR